MECFHCGAEAPTREIRPVPTGPTPEGVRVWQCASRAECDFRRRRTRVRRGRLIERRG